MGFLDKVKTATEQAVARGKEELEEQKTKRELNQAYSDLGEAAFGLVDSGALSHDGLTESVCALARVGWEFTVTEIVWPAVPRSSAAGSWSFFSVLPRTFKR